jgi:hypothetical protein
LQSKYTRVEMHLDNKTDRQMRAQVAQSRARVITVGTAVSKQRGTNAPGNEVLRAAVAINIMMALDISNLGGLQVRCWICAHRHVAIRIACREELRARPNVADLTAADVYTTTIRSQVDSGIVAMQALR